MTKSQIKQLSHEKLFALSLKRGSLNRYTQEALYAQELFYTEMFLPHEVSNEPAPFDYEPFSHAVVKTSKNTKHVYKINFATAVNICMAYLKHGGDETETMLLIQKYLTPARYHRKHPIYLSPKRNRDFMYRVA